MEKNDESALFELASLILKDLNITAILPYLVEQDLTTSEEREILLNQSINDIEKKRKLVFLWLPQKGNNSLDRFIQALKESKEGTNHETLAHKIQDKRVAKEDEGIANGHAHAS